MISVNKMIQNENAVKIYRLLEDYDELTPCCENNNNDNCEFKRLRNKFNEIFLELKNNPRKMKFFKWRLSMARIQDCVRRKLCNIPRTSDSVPIEQYELDIMERLRKQNNEL